MNPKRTSSPGSPAQRIRIYPEKGFQIFQEIPEGVWKAWERLVELAFDEHLVH